MSKPVYVPCLVNRKNRDEVRDVFTLSGRKNAERMGAAQKIQTGRYEFGVTVSQHTITWQPSRVSH